MATDIGLRVAGLGSLWVARFSWQGLRGIAGAGGFHHAPPLAAFALALLVFLTSSIGAGLIALGHHIFDRVEVASRWRRLDAGSSRPAALIDLQVGSSRLNSSSSSS